jgi:hypothetical protein
MDAAERALLTSTVEDVLTKADEHEAADRALTELGWYEMLATAPDDAVGIVFGALGRTNAAATVLDDVLLGALDLAPGADLAVLLPAFGTWQPPGRVGAGQVRAFGLATSRVCRVEAVMIVCRTGSQMSIVTVPRSGLVVREAAGVDIEGGLRVVRAEGGGAVERVLDGAAWDAAVAAGRRAMAHEIAGACRTMLTLARAHALERVQFDRPVAAFQAVRHRLADVLVAVEALEATLVAAADEPGNLTAALAKASAGRAARVAAANCQQVLAGVGFTTDHPFHRYLKRTMVLEGLFGTADDIALDLGRQLLAERRVPTLIDL